jgi:bifunctional polynucleotide phosphatase/kinase
MEKINTKRKAKSDETTASKRSKKNSVDEVEEEINHTNGSSTTSIQGDWKNKGSVLYRDFGTKPSDKIVCFDLDDTLITTKSGAKFAANQNDWKILYENIPCTLEKYLKDGFKIVVFTNQGGISKGKTNKNEWSNKVNAVQKFLNVPLQVYSATETDYYRKPAIGMWELMANDFNGKVKIDLNKSMYVGDAAGRPKTKNRGKDFSDSDHKFAKNIGISFHTPEMFFKGEKETLPEFEFDPKSLKIPNQTLFKGIKSADEKSKLKGTQVEMIIFIGSPGSGKSTFYHTYLKPNGYIHVNQDTLKNAQKCLKVSEEELSKGNSVVIDNTNPSLEARKQYIDLAKSLKVGIRTFVFNFSKDLVFHLNEMRGTNVFRSHNSKSVADVIIHTWYKKFVQPSPKEGFSEILEVNFIPGPFVNEEDERTFYCYS